MPASETTSILLELIIMVSIILTEIYLFITTFIQSKEFESIFKVLPKLELKLIEEKEGDEGQEDLQNEETEGYFDAQVFTLSYKGGNKVQQELVSTINKYLINNRGAAIDYHILKEIVSRQVESLENIIETRIPSPLYFGLAGTMIGIIIGLFKIDFSIASIEGIEPLINGVKIAMIASVTGLILTSILSIFIFKKAKEQMEEGKNKFLGFIQTELLPSLMGHGQSGMVTLSTKLDDFGRNTVSAVDHMNTIVRNSNGQVRASQKLLKDIESIDLKNITGANLKVFRKLETMKESLEHFPGYYERLNESLLGTTNLLRAINELLDRTDNFDQSLKLLNSGVEQSNKAATFFNTHVGTFIEYKESVNKAVSESNDAMVEAIGTLEKSSNELFQNFNKQLLNYDDQLTKAFNNSITEYNKTLLELTTRTIESLKGTQPQFDKLESLPFIKTELQLLNSTFEKKLNQLDQGLNSKLRDLIEATNSSPKPQSVDKSVSTNSEQKGRMDPIIDRSLKVVLLLAGLVIVSYGIHSVLLFWA